MGQHKIKFLDDISHIRRRPGMYIDDIGTPKTLVKELVDNSIDEILNGYGKRIEITSERMNEDQYAYTVSDDCGGLPLYQVKELEGQTAARLIFTKSFSSGKFDHTRYKMSCGLHGLGLTIVNALSSRIFVQVHDRKKGRIYTLKTKDGQVVNEGFSKIPEEPPWWSTSILMEPDKTIFHSTKTRIDSSPFKLIKLERDCSITVNGQEVKVFDPKSDIDSKVLQDYLTASAKITDKNGFEMRMSLGFTWSNTSFDESVYGAVNAAPCHNGMHIKEAKWAVGKSLEKLDDRIGMDDSCHGLRMFVSMFAANPVYTGQTKHRLAWADGYDQLLAKRIQSEVEKLLEENGDLRDQVVRRIVAYKKEMDKLSDMQLINSVVKQGDDRRTSKGVGIGIFDCTSKDRDSTELYIVEGKSAAGNLVAMRSIATQAVLPLRGKPLNVAKTTKIKTILDNKEVVSLITCIGVGMHPHEDVEKCRYGKIIICTDSDPDGSQISALIVGALTFLTPKLVESGIVYEIDAPLYAQNGKFVWDEKGINKAKPFDRFKGLGSMSPEEVKHALLDASTRRLRRIVLDNKSHVLEIVQSAREKKNIMFKHGVIKTGVYDKY